MPASTSPNGLVENYFLIEDNVNGPHLQIPLNPNLFPGLALEEARAGTGDYRKILYAFLKGFHAMYSTLGGTDKPKKISITKSGRTAVDANTSRETFILTFDLDTSDIDVSSEI